MSLRVWLPLNGNLNNQGSDNPILSSTTPVYSSDGKIGKALSLSSSGNSTVKINWKPEGNQMSMTMWVKPSSTGLWSDIFSFGDNNSRIELSNSSNYTYTWYGTGTGGTDIIPNGTSLFNLPNNTWSHIAITISGSIVSFYLNGSLVKNVTQTNQLSSNFTTKAFFYLGARVDNSSKYTGLLNDFCIYDHVLSAKEVKEISKGLIVHYPLNSNGLSIPNLISNSLNFNGWAVSSGWTIGTSDDGSKMYSFSRTGATSNNWVRLIPTLRVDGNNYPDGITVSFDLLTPDKSAINQKCLGSLQQYDSNGSRTGWYEPGWDLTNVVNNQWSRVSFTFTKSALLTNSQGLVYSYTMFSFQLVQNGNISIRKIKAEAGTKATPYSIATTDSYNPSTEIDVSGYQRHASIIGTLEYTSDTPKYLSSTYFNSAGHIKNDSFGVTVNAFTLNLWVNPKSISNQHFIFGTFDSWTNNGIGVWRDAGSTPGKYNCLIRSAAESSYSNNPISTTLNSWNMITLVYTGTVYIRYLNGVEQGRVTYGSSGVITNPNFMIGNSKYNGTPSSENEQAYISDVRFYVTALSADDIKELYQTSTSISNNGTIFCLDIQEN